MSLRRPRSTRTGTRFPHTTLFRSEAFVRLALDEFKEDRADHRLAENLEQQPRGALGGRAVEQDAARLQFRDRLAMAGEAFGEQLVIGFGRRRRERIAERGELVP